MNLPCKELKRIARDNLNGNYKIPMGAFLAATLIPLAVELPFSMLQKDAQPLPVTIMFLCGGISDHTFKHGIVCRNPSASSVTCTEKRNDTWHGILRV